ncbi:unnamed protein product, partial [Laminaria digitata]
RRSTSTQPAAQEAAAPEQPEVVVVVQQSVASVDHRKELGVLAMPAVNPVPASPMDAILSHGAAKRDMGRVKLALAAGANANGPRELPYAPIMSAVAWNDVDMVKLFIEHGADPNKAADHDLHCPSMDDGIMPEERALHLAAKTGNVETVRLLVRASADPNATDMRGRTPLMAACACLKDCVAMARVLLELGANPALAENGYTPLHAIAQHGVMDLVDTLYAKAPAALNSYSVHGRTPLFMASVEGRESMVSRLLSLGAAEQMPQYEPTTSPLAMAVVKGHEGVVRVLINEGMRATGGTMIFPAALHGAVLRSHTRKTIRLLLAAEGEERRSFWANISIDGKHLLYISAGVCCPNSTRVLLAAGAVEAKRDSEGRILRDAIGLDLGRDRLPTDREKEVAIRRMLEQGPAYRARSWAWPAEDADGRGCGGDSG